LLQGGLRGSLSKMAAHFCARRVPAVDVR